MTYPHLHTCASMRTSPSSAHGTDARRVYSAVHAVSLLGPVFTSGRTTWPRAENLAGESAFLQTPPNGS